MTRPRRLDDRLNRPDETGSSGSAVTAAIEAIAAASIEISALIGRGHSGDSLGEMLGRNSDGDVQRDLDLRADALLRSRLAAAPIAALASEEMPEPEIADRRAPICVAIDPLDGSSNIDINMTVGSIFSILPVADDLARSFHQPGSAQLAAGFVTYGPQTSLVLTRGAGVDIFVLDREAGEFHLARSGVQVTPVSDEFAINVSNRRHWEPPVRAFIDECLGGTDGSANRNFNMRWIGSLVAEAFRILTRGGVFLYPSDARPGYGEGRLRLTYEAHPMALIMEQAGGAASTGRQRILDLAADDLHQRVPLVMGSRNEVRRVEEFHGDPSLAGGAPLFARRGFFR